MSFKPSDNDEIIADINMTPLIDIMLVLLILFMVTSSVSLESGLDVDLPDVSSTNSKDQSEKAVIVSIDKKGQIFVAGEQVTFETLEEAIRQNVTKIQSSFIILEGDKNSSLETAMRIMDIAKNAGGKRFGIAAESNN